MNAKLIRYGVVFVVGALLVLWVLCSRGMFTEPDIKERMRILSDGFFTSGVVLSGAGLLSWIGNKGGFDIFGYATSQILGMFSRSYYTESQGGYYDYKQKKAKKRGNAPLYILWVGLGYLFLAVLFTVLYAVI